MANAAMNTDLVDKAIRFAVDAHHGTERRGKGYPYIIHCLEAMEIVATMTPDPQILAAAVLHDTMEDCGVTFEQLQKEFGPVVARLVRSESEEPVVADTNAGAQGAPVDESLTWRSRKLAGIERLKAAAHDEKIVAMGDKLSNMRAIWRDYQVQGDKLWDIFHAPGGKSDHKWRYLALADAFDELKDSFAYKEFVYLVHKVFD